MRKGEVAPLTARADAAAVWAHLHDTGEPLTRETLFAYRRRARRPIRKDALAELESAAGLSLSVRDVAILSSRPLLLSATLRELTQSPLNNDSPAMLNRLMPAAIRAYEDDGRAPDPDFHHEWAQLIAEVARNGRTAEDLAEGAPPASRSQHIEAMSLQDAIATRSRSVLTRWALEAREAAMFASAEQSLLLGVGEDLLEQAVVGLADVAQVHPELASHGPAQQV